jgi:hypothetical protein
MIFRSAKSNTAPPLRRFLSSRPGVELLHTAQPENKHTAHAPPNLGSRYDLAKAAPTDYVARPLEESPLENTTD